jgi:hypothetical protein
MLFALLPYTILVISPKSGFLSFLERGIRKMKGLCLTIHGGNYGVGQAEKN